MKFQKQATPLLELLQSRWDDFVKGLPDRPVRPILHMPDVREAARLWAKANPSDPFAYQRMITNITHGYSSVSEVRADASRILQAQHAAAT